MKNMTIFKCNTVGANGVPFLPVGAFVRGILDPNNVVDPLGRCGSSNPLGSQGVAASLPPVEFFETPDSYMVILEASGLSKDDIKISFHEGSLILSGKKVPSEVALDQKDKRKYYLNERYFGEFSRTLEIPSLVKASEITASYKDGVLMVLLPKAEEAKPHTIEVKVG